MTVFITLSVKHYYSAFYETFYDQNYKKNIQQILSKINKNKNIVKKFKGCHLYVLRIKRENNQLSNSKPCLWCSKLINAIPLKKVTFSTGNVSHPWEYVKPKHLTSNHVSIGVKSRENGEFNN